MNIITRAKIYVALIRKNIKTIDDVPPTLKETVIILLKK